MRGIKVEMTDPNIESREKIISGVKASLCGMS